MKKMAYALQRSYEEERLPDDEVVYKGPYKIQ